MSIASEITRLQTSKADIKTQVNIDVDDINEGTDFINDETFDDYADLIENMQDAYKQYIPIHTKMIAKGNTTQNGTPTPSSPIPVNNVTGEQVVTICGGKNLMKLNLITTPTTYSSVTFTPNDDGTITLNGTATSTRWVDLSNIDYGSTTFNLGEVTNTIKSLTSNNYTMSAKITNEKVNVNYNANNKFTSCYIYKDTNYNNAILQIQLEQGTSATSFEKYQGKDYEINLGKNLLKLDTITGTKNGVTYNWEGNKLTLNGTTTAETDIYNFGWWGATTKNNDRYLSPGTYILSIQGASNAGKFSINSYYGTTSVISLFRDNTSATKTLNSGTYYSNCYISILSNKTFDNEVFYIQLEKNNVMTSYSPYFTPIELNKIGNYQDFIRKGAGKNLFIPTLKFDDTNISTTRCSVSLNGDEYTFSATGSDCYFGNMVGTGNAYNKAFGILYDVSGITNLVFKPTNLAFNKNYVCYYDNNKVLLGYGQIDNNTGLITPIANTKYISFRIGISNSVSGTNYTTKIQLEKGSSATSYEPYGYKDKWYIEKNVGKVVLNGSESCSRQVLSGNIVRFMFTGRVDGIGGARQTIFSNYFAANLNSANDREGIGFVYGNLLYLYKQEASAADFQTWLNTHNTSVYYVLNAPEYTLIENEELINQLEAVQLQTGKNNVLVSGDLPMILDLSKYIQIVGNHL